MGATSEDGSSISTASIQSMVDKLKTQGIRNSTRRNYYSVWKQFNLFYIKLDHKPDNWEERVVLFVGYLIEIKRTQSQTGRSYVSAIKKVLWDDGILLNEDRVLINSLTKACKIKNDRIRHRLPIKKPMLHMLLNKLIIHYQDQPYLKTMYCALFSTTYYGLFRVGVLTAGTHPVMVNDVRIDDKKELIQLILRTSKTHGYNNHPQKIKITKKPTVEAEDRSMHPQFCPYLLLQKYVWIRPRFQYKCEPFFIFRDFAPVTPNHICNLLHTLLDLCRFDSKYYDLHSLHQGQTIDLYDLGLLISRLKSIGRWKSNAIYRYLTE